MFEQIEMQRSWNTIFESLESFYYLEVQKAEFVSFFFLEVSAV